LIKKLKKDSKALGKLKLVFIFEKNLLDPCSFDFRKRIQVFLKVFLKE